MAQYPNYPQMDTTPQTGMYQQTPGSYPSFQQTYPQFPQQTPSYPSFPSTSPFQQPGATPFFEQSYIENILRLNKGKIATVYMNFENSQWGSKIFKGVIEAAGKDHIILSDPATGMRYVLLTIFLNYITFDEEINYDYPFAAPASPALGTAAPIFNAPTPNIPVTTPTQSVPQFTQPTTPYTQIRKKENNNNK